MYFNNLFWFIRKHSTFNSIFSEVQTMLPRARKNDLLIESSGNELLIYDCIKNKGISLNQTSALVWGKCDGLKSPWQIQKELCTELNAVITEEMVWTALSQFRDNELLIDELERKYGRDANSHDEHNLKTQAA
ncbi:MAG: hypothetical protein KDB79_12450 [Acidobacteria bacterium]|nr:hypothetical protein [Acidobacteriota bacterium]